jgi:hypothetical protein
MQIRLIYKVDRNCSGVDGAVSPGNIDQCSWKCAKFILDEKFNEYW